MSDNNFSVDMTSQPAPSREERPTSAEACDGHLQPPSIDPHPSKPSRQNPDHIEDVSTKADLPSDPVSSTNSSTSIRKSSRSIAEAAPHRKKWIPSPLQILFSFLAMLSGAAMVLNAAIAMQLTAIVGHTFWAGAINDSGAAILMCFAALPGTPDLFHATKHAVQENHKNHWLTFMWFGGLLGAFYVALSVALPPIIGFGLLFVCVVCGQILGSLLVDRYGLMWSQPVQLRWVAYLGAAVVAVGTIMFQFDLILESSTSPIIALYIVLGILSGAGFVVQTSMNRKIGSYLGTPYRGSWVSFVVGSVGLLIVAASVYSSPSLSTAKPSDIWKFIGCALAAYGVTIATIAPTFLGYAATFCWTILGQLMASLIFDATGFLGSDVHEASPLRICGVIIVLGGVLLVQFGKNVKASAQPTQEGDCTGVVLSGHTTDRSNPHQAGTRYATFPTADKSHSLELLNLHATEIPIAQTSPASTDGETDKL